MILPRFLLCFALLLGAAMTPGPLAAGTTASPVALTLLHGGEGEAGLLLRLQPGWKFYWRQPGEGGIPPRFDWSASQNLSDITVFWPAPRRITLGELDILGYSREVLLPLTYTRLRQDQPARLVLEIEYGVCKEVCLLRQDRLELAVPTGNVPGDPVAAGLIQRYRAMLPRSPGQLGLQVESIEPSTGSLRLLLQASSGLRAPDLFVEGPPAYWFGRPAWRQLPDGRIEVRLPFQPAMLPDLNRLRFTLVETGATIPWAAEFSAPN